MKIQPIFYDTTMISNEILYDQTPHPAVGSRPPGRSAGKALLAGHVVVKLVVLVEMFIHVHSPKKDNYK